MKSLRKSLIQVAIFLSFSNCVFAASQYGVTVTLVGMASDGGQVYMGIIPNTNACLYNGIYFKDPAELNKALSIALSAKMAGKTVRVDFSQPDGSGTQCFGHAVFVE